MRQKEFKKFLNPEDAVVDTLKSCVNAAAIESGTTVVPVVFQHAAWMNY